MLVSTEPSTPPPHVLDRAAPVNSGLATHPSWTPVVLETYGHARIIELKQNDTLATSSAVLCALRHRALVTRRLQAGCRQGAA